MLKSIDLFSGGGGLSEGMKQAGFDIVSAVELDPTAADTFRCNHPSTNVIERDIRYVAGDEILKPNKLVKGELDLLAGCPPCQGFSALTRKYNKDDARNSLIKEVTRLITELEPKSLMIENVPGMMTKGKPFLDEFLRAIKKLGYIANFDVLQVADYGVPQDRRRFVLLAGKGFEIKLPKPTHSKDGGNGLLKWKTVSQALNGLDEPISLSRAKSYGGPQKFNWHIVRDISELNIERFKFLKPGGSRFDIPEHLRPDCHKGNSLGFSNFYGRMSWNDVSPTITGGCTAPSKGRFGHPDKLRTISVREAARLQTFPDSYKFSTNFIDHACKVIGNALPCEFARKMSEACYVAVNGN